jgi:hypothetical protein
LICKEHLNPNFYAYHTVWSVHSTPPLTTKSTATTLNNIGLDTFHLNTAMRSLSKALVTNFGFLCYLLSKYAIRTLNSANVGVAGSFASGIPGDTKIRRP